jgi:hypothetical protein
LFQIKKDSTAKTEFNNCPGPNRADKETETSARQKQKKNPGKSSSLLNRFLSGSALPNGVGSGGHCSLLLLRSTYKRCETYLSRVVSLSGKDV